MRSSPGKPVREIAPPMPGKWVGGKGSLACPQKGQYIEAHVFDDKGKEQGTVFLLVKRLFVTGSAGRSLLCDLVTATDEYYLHWTRTKEGSPTTVDGNYHLCKVDPTICVGGPAGSYVVHLGKWRLWKEEALIAGEVPDLSDNAEKAMRRFFKGWRCRQCT